jgi:uncharacterized protein
MSALDLDLLSEYLDGDQNEYGLDFAATHGFLCAIAVGPTFAKWLDELFDNNQKKVPAEIIAQVKAWSFKQRSRRRFRVTCNCVYDVQIYTTFI